MMGWIIGIVTGILLLFVFWRGASKAYRERAEEPKYRFLENLGIAPEPERLAGRSVVQPSTAQPRTQSQTSQEENNGSTHS